MIAKAEKLETALRYHLPVLSLIKPGSVSVLEDITAIQNRIIVKTGGFEPIYKPNKDKTGLFKCGPIYCRYKQERITNLYRLQCL